MGQWRVRASNGEETTVTTPAVDILPSGALVFGFRRLDETIEPSFAFAPDAWRGLRRLDYQSELDDICAKIEAENFENQAGYLKNFLPFLQLKKLLEVPK